MRIVCAGCGESFRVPADQDGSDSGDVWLADDEGPEAPAKPKVARPRTESAQKKICPMCGQQEDFDARRCRHCGEALAGLQGADGYAIEGVWRAGNRLVMAKEALLPAICVQTNQPTAERLRRRLYWHNPWIYLLLLPGCGLLPYVIVALIVREKADIMIGLCRERIVRRRWIIFGAWIGVFLGIGICATGGQLGIDVSPVVWITGLLVQVVSMIGGVILSRIVAPTRITSRYVWLKGVHPAYLAALPVFPGER